MKKIHFINEVRHWGFVLLALLVMALFVPLNASALDLSSGKLKFNAKKGDTLSLKGSYDDLEFEDGVVQVDAGIFTQTISLDDFQQKGAKLSYVGPKGEMGVTKMTFDTSKQTFDIAINAVFATQTNPFPLRLTNGAIHECTMPKFTVSKSGWSFSEKKNDQSACQISDPPFIDDQYNLGSQVTAILVNQYQYVRVQLRIIPNPDLDKTSVMFYAADNTLTPIGDPLCNLLDDGILSNGDEIASDGVYSCKTTLTSSSTGELRFIGQAKLGDDTIYSPSVVIKVLEPLTEEDAQMAQDNQAAADATWLEKLDELGDTKKARSETVKAVKAMDGVKSAGIAPDGVTIWIEYDSGIMGGIMANPEGTRGSDANSLGVRMSRAQKTTESGPPYSFPTMKNLISIKADEEDIPVDNNNVLIWDAYNSQFSPFDEGPELQKLFKDNKCPKFTVTYLKDFECTIDTVNTFTNYGTVILVTHGAVDKDGNVVFLTREQVSNYKMLTNMLLLLQKKVIVMGNWFAIAPSYISSLSGTFSNGIIYNGSCNSSNNATMSNAFIGKGAKAYFGFTKVVNSDFAQSVANQLFAKLVTDMKNTGDAFSPVAPKTDPTAPNAVFTHSGSQKSKYSGDFKNGDFEKGNLTGWAKSGDGRVVAGLGEWTPPQGTFMGLISTGLGYTTSSGSIEQNFCLAKDAKEIKFDWNFNSEELQEYCNSSYDDRFIVELVTESSTNTLFQTSVNTICGTGPMIPTGLYFDQSYPGCVPTTDVGYGTGGNDCTVWSTDWQSQAVDISAIAAANDGKGVTLKFSSTDVGDSIYDSAIALDKVEITKPAPPAAPVK